MSFYAIPSLINLIIKFWLFLQGRQSLVRENRCLGLLLLAFFSLNLAEFISFGLIDQPQYSEVIGRFYYITVIFVITMMLAYADHLTFKKIPQGILLFLATCLSLSVVFTDYIIAGVTNLGYTNTRIAGDYYWTFQVFVFLSTISSVVLLFMGSCSLPDRRQRRICSIILYSFIPIVLTIFTVVIMMALGYKINAAIYLTSSITIFLVIVIYAEINYRFMNFLSTAPMLGSRLSSSFFRAFSGLFKEKSLDIRSFIKELEGIFIVCAFEMCNGNRQEAADLLGIPQSTFNEKLRKLK